MDNVVTGRVVVKIEPDDGSEHDNPDPFEACNTSASNLVKIKEERPDNAVENPLPSSSESLSVPNTVSMPSYSQPVSDTSILCQQQPLLPNIRIKQEKPDTVDEENELNVCERYEQTNESPQTNTGVVFQPDPLETNSQFGSSSEQADSNGQLRVNPVAVFLSKNRQSEEFNHPDTDIHPLPLEICIREPEQETVVSDQSKPNTVQIKQEKLENDDLVQFDIHVVRIKEEKDPECDQSTLQFPIKIKQEYSDTQLIDSIQKPEQNKPYECNICHYKCVKASLLKRHMRTHSQEKPFVCEICDYRSSRVDNLKKHMKTHTDKKLYSCTKCVYSTLIRRELKIHMRAHGERRIFECDICEYKCLRKISLKHHIKTHTGEMPYACTICDYKCIRPETFKAHCAGHSGYKPFACTLCPYRTLRSDSLKKHLIVHTQEKPFACHICHFKTGSSKDLKRHIQTHTGEKPYACDFCSYRTVSMYNLKNHRRRHTGERPYKCTLCENTYTRADSMQKHMKSAHVDTSKPFECTYCEYKCNQKGMLTRHIRSHTGEKHKCDYCEFQCFNISYLKKHRNKKHPDVVVLV